jgi:hypothetical protein
LSASNGVSLINNSLSLTHDDSNASYAIIRHNIRTYLSAGVVKVLRAKRDAEAALKELEDFQGSTDQHQGWRYFIEKSSLKAGTDPAEATRLRQSDLEAREAKALQESGNTTKPFPFKQYFG